MTPIGYAHCMGGIDIIQKKNTERYAESVHL